MSDLGLPDYADMFMQEVQTSGDYRTLHSYGGSYWVFDRGAYRVAHLPEVHAKVIRWLKASGIHLRTEGDFRLIMTYILAELEIRTPPRMPIHLGEGHAGEEYIAFADGLLNLSEFTSTGQVNVRPVDPGWFNSIVIPHSVREVDKRECPVWTRCMGEWVDRGTGEFLQEFTGLLLTTDRSHELGIFLAGEGENGKSTFIRTVKWVLGERNVSAVPLEHFNMPFELYSTVGKLLNVSAETERCKLPTARLKAFLSADCTSFPIKHQAVSWTGEPTARLMVAWNDPPSVTDGTTGFWRKVAIVPFDRRFSRGKGADPTLKNKLAGELPGILWWALQGLRRLRERGYFDFPPAVRMAVERMRDGNDPARAFLREKVDIAEGAVVRWNDLMTALEEWKATIVAPDVDRDTMMKALRSVYPSAIVDRVDGGDGRLTVVRGIRII